MAYVGGQAAVRGASEETQHRLLPTDCCPGRGLTHHASHRTT